MSFNVSRWGLSVHPLDMLSKSFITQNPKTIKFNNTNDRRVNQSSQSNRIMILCGISGCVILIRFSLQWQDNNNNNRNSTRKISRRKIQLSRNDLQNVQDFSNLKMFQSCIRVLNRRETLKCYLTVLLIGCRHSGVFLCWVSDAIRFHSHFDVPLPPGEW